MQDIEKYITERETHGITSFALSTLSNHRHLGIGIPYIKLKHSIRYKLSDVIAYMEARRIQTDDR
jgi:hypothetical protein